MLCPMYRDRLQRHGSSAMPPVQGLSLNCDTTFFTEEVGGDVAAIVCDITENTVRQGSGDSCLAIEEGGLFWLGH